MSMQARPVITRFPLKQPSTASVAVVALLPTLKEYSVLTFTPKAASKRTALTWWHRIQLIPAETGLRLASLTEQFASRFRQTVKLTFCPVTFLRKQT